MKTTTEPVVGNHYHFKDPVYGEFKGYVTFYDCVFIDIELTSDLYDEGEVYREAGEEITLTSFDIEATPVEP